MTILSHSIVDIDLSISCKHTYKEARCVELGYLLLKIVQVVNLLADYLC